MSIWIYFTTMGVMFGTLLAIFAIRYWAQVQQARAQATARQQDTSALQAIQSDIADVRSRLTAIETVLKTVE